MAAPLKRLPIGINSLRTIIDNDMVYVDKTAFAWDLAQAPGRYFLSRPRRFGKSLFVDTLQALFEGEEALFRGLDVHPRWDWSRRYPVIKLDLAGGVLQSREALDEALRERLAENQRRLGITCTAKSIPGCFGELIREARARHGRGVAILVDEYDKPILDNIENPGLAAQLREGLKNLYSVMKAEDAHIQFVFMTGVSKFSKVSLFSGLNQLEDITLDSRYATLCGYTRRDLETDFGDHLQGVDRAELERWYNGYGFLGERVYNPYDILLFISKGRSYRNYWFDATLAHPAPAAHRPSLDRTGSPTFLVKLFQQQRYFLPDLEALEVSEEILDSFDVERIDPVTLLFQSGYLTIAGARQRFGQQMFRLRIPNQEVRVALNNQFTDAFTGHFGSERTRWQQAVYDPLSRGDLDATAAAIQRLFAGIPWRNFTQNDLTQAEGYYASVLYAFFASLNAEVIPEDLINRGQADLTVRLAGYTYVIEIKLDRGPPAVDDAAPNPALEQVRARGYSEKCRGAPGKGLYEVGLVFSSEARNLVRADWVRVA